MALSVQLQIVIEAGWENVTHHLKKKGAEREWKRPASSSEDSRKVKGRSEGKVFLHEGSLPFHAYRKDDNFQQKFN